MNSPTKKSFAPVVFHEGEPIEGNKTFSARINNLEVCLIGEHSATISVYESADEPPCSFGYTCPINNQYDENKCPYDHCPYLDGLDGYVGGASIGFEKDVQALLRDMFAKGHDGIAHKTEWPPEAKRFAKSDWLFVEKEKDIFADRRRLNQHGRE